jgi:hypothetical protein
MNMLKRRRRKGSHAIEFGLLFPVFLVFSLAFLNLVWYLMQRENAEYAVSAACKTGAITGMDPSSNPADIAMLALEDGLSNSILSCSYAQVDCSIVVEEIEGYTSTTSRLRCSVEAPTHVLANLVPTTPDMVFAQAIWPIEPVRTEDTADTGI